MQLNISGHHIELTQALKEHAHSKLIKIKKHFKQVMNINLVLEVEKTAQNPQKAEATIHISGQDLFAKVASDDMYHSINELVKKLDAQVQKHKDKIQKHH